MSDPSNRPVAQLVITQHADGAVSIGGPIGDVPWALSMLDHARSAIKNQARPRSEIILPPNHVDANLTRST